MLFSDTLATSSSNWTRTTPSGNGALSFTNSTLAFSVSPATTDDIGIATLTAFQASTTYGWTVQVDVHLAASAGLTTSQYANLNLLVAKATDWQNYNANIALDRYNNGTSVVLDIDNYIKTAGAETHLGEIVNGTTDATLLIAYNATNNTLTYSYDANGATDGYNYVTAYTESISGWNMTSTDHFAFILAGGAGTTNTSNSLTGPTISTTDAYFTNFSVSSVPEPSAYAAMAGIAVLGLTWWLRRRP